MNDQKRAKNAVKLIRSLFKTSKRDGCITEVWDLLTSLRGPDDEERDELKKDNITAGIRCYLGADVDNTYCASRNIPIKKMWNYFTKHCNDGGHLDDHLFGALLVLKNSRK